MCYIEHNIFANVSTNAIIDQFQNMKAHLDNCKWLMDIYDIGNIIKKFNFVHFMISI